jgi:uncharacterized membrane protein YvlD (DUF360 family)
MKLPRPRTARRWSINSVRSSWIATALVTAIAAALYRATVHPGVGPYLDSIEYQITTLVLGVSHPPGYPLFTGLGRLFTELVPIGNAAHRLNVFCAVCSVVTVALIQRLTYRLTRRTLLSLFGALSLAVAVRFWYQASYTELYPLNGAFIAATTLALVTWMETRRPVFYFLSVALYALNFGVNVPAIVLLPMWLWAVVATDHRMLTRPRNLGLTVLIVLLAASQYLYVPLRAFQRPPFCNYCPESWGEVPDFLLGREWWGIAFGVQPRYYLQRWADSGYQLMLQFWPLGVLLGGIGLWRLVRKQTRRGILFLLGLAGEWIFVVTYDVVDWADFMHPIYILYAPLIAVGLGAVWDWLSKRTAASAASDRTVTMTALSRGISRVPGLRRLAPAVARASQRGWVRVVGRGLILGLTVLSVAGLLVATGINNFPLVDQSENTAWHAWSRDLLNRMEPGAWVLTPPTPTDGFIQTWALRFVSWSESRGPDMSIVYLPGLDPPGPPPGYLRWEEAAPHLSEHPLYVVELEDERLENYALLPIERDDEWVIGYRVVGERTPEGEIVPWVTDEEWESIQEIVLLP